MTATVQASEAADRLREVIRPGGTVQVIGRGFTRSDIEKVTVSTRPHDLSLDVTEWVRKTLQLRYVPNTQCLGLRPNTSADLLLDRLSVVLFGELGQIRRRVPVSIHHEVSIHCDGCGAWEWGKDRSTRARRAAGWRDWTENGRYGRRTHLCPRCTVTTDGETAPVRAS